MPYQAVSPWIYLALADLTSASAGESMTSGMTGWWHQAYLADQAKRWYMQAGGADDLGAPPAPTASAASYSGWKALCEAAVDEFGRQVALAGLRKDEHRHQAATLAAEAAALRGQLLAGDCDEAEAEARSAGAAAAGRAAAEQEALAGCAMRWCDAALSAAHAGRDLIDDEARRAAGLVRAAGAARLLGGAADGKWYQAGYGRAA
jgi:hypothetical protein